MCIQFYRYHTCGCTKPEEFKQCPERQGTNGQVRPIEEGSIA